MLGATVRRFAQGDRVALEAAPCANEGWPSAELLVIPSREARVFVVQHCFRLPVQRWRGTWV